MILVLIVLTVTSGVVAQETTPEPTYTDWREMPVIPQVSDRMREVYALGQELGNDPHAFSIVGDCQNVSAYFLADFDHPLQYDLGEYADLQAVVDQFAGS